MFVQISVKRHPKSVIAKPVAVQKLKSRYMYKHKVTLTNTHNLKNTF